MSCTHFNNCVISRADTQKVFIILSDLIVYRKWYTCLFDLTFTLLFIKKNLPYYCDLEIKRAINYHLGNNITAKYSDEILSLYDTKDLTPLYIGFF